MKGFNFPGCHHLNIFPWLGLLCTVVLLFWNGVINNYIILLIHPCSYLQIPVKNLHAILDTGHQFLFDALMYSQIKMYEPAISDKLHFACAVRICTCPDGVQHFPGWLFFLLVIIIPTCLLPYFWYIERRAILGLSIFTYGSRKNKKHNFITYYKKSPSPW